MCGGCTTGLSTCCLPPTIAPYNPCCVGPCCVPPCVTPGNDVPLDQLPLTNPNAGINTPLDPITSPNSSGATDNPPSPSGGGGGGSGATVPIGGKPNVGGSGAGTANSKLGGITIPRLVGAPISTANPLNTLGSVLASLFGGSAATTLAKRNASNALVTAKPIVTSTSFTIVILVVGALMLFLAFSKGGE